ncbi:MarR family winged helix-turn-helix transcriptional regulator [Sporosarcina sp. ITBMC105]
MTIHQEFFSQYAKIYRPLLNELNAELGQFGLSHSQWTIMKLLKSEGAMTPAEIAIRQRVEKPSITKILQRLAELDYIEVTPGKDKREKWIRLTDSGEAIFLKVTEQLNRLYENLLQSASIEDLQTSIRLMERVYENLSK